jgi:hypothetical protein
MIYFQWIETEGSGWNSTLWSGWEKPWVPEAKPFFPKAEITALRQACNGRDHRPSLPYVLRPGRTPGNPAAGKLQQDLSGIPAEPRQRF